MYIYNILPISFIFETVQSFWVTIGCSPLQHWIFKRQYIICLFTSEQLGSNHAYHWSQFFLCFPCKDVDWLNFNCKSGDLKTRISGIQHKTHHTWKHHQPSEILDVWQLFNTKRLTPMMLHHVFFYYLVDLSTFIPTLRMVYYIWFSHIFNMYQMVSSLKFQGPAFQQPINKCFFKYND